MSEPEPVVGTLSNCEDLSQSDGSNCDTLSVIPQCDGNVSLTSDTENENRSETNSRENENVTKGFSNTKEETLLTIAVANLRSLRPRINAIVEKMRNEEIEVMIINEAWEPGKNKSFQMSLQKIYEMKGLKIVTC